MNKRGQTMGLAILAAVGVFIIGLMFVNFIMPEIAIFRGAMDCASADTISSGTKVICLIGDATVPYLIVAIVSLAIGAITSRLNL